MGQKHPSLAVGNLAQRATVLPGHSRRLPALLGKIAAVQHPHRFRVLQPGTQILLQPANHPVIIPGRFGEKTLQRPGRRRNRLGQILGVAPLPGLHQQALQIMTAQFPGLLAAKGRRKIGLEFLKGIVDPLQRRRIHHPVPPPEAFAISPLILPSNRRCNTRSLAGKPLAGFYATRSRRIQVLNGMVLNVIRCNTHYFIDNRR